MPPEADLLREAVDDLLTKYGVNDIDFRPAMHYSLRKQGIDQRFLVRWSRPSLPQAGKSHWRWW
jgi:hypothetical protein